MIISKAVENYEKGVKIPLSTLADKGYLDSKDVKTLEKQDKLKNKSGNLYVLLAKEEGYCGTGASYRLSWTMDEQVEVFLCNNKTTSGG